MAGRLDRTAGNASDRLPASGTTAVVASARTLKSSKAGGRGSKAVREQAWQKEAWDFVDTVGELGYVVDQTARAASRAHLRVMKAPLIPGDDPVPLDTDSPNDMLAASLMLRFGGGMAGQALLIDRIVGHLKVAGDSFLLGAPPDDEGPAPINELVWQALAPGELKDLGGSWQVDGGHGRKVYKANEVIVIRIWTPHRRESALATSPVMRNLPVLRELHGLTMDVAARIDSRLAGAGILVLPQEITWPALPEDSEEDALEGVDRFVEDLSMAMTTAIENRGSAEALVPIVIQIPGEHINQVRLISFSQDLAEVAKTLRDEAIRRLALGLDAPPSVLLDVASNHWQDWTSKQDFVDTHIEPLMTLICDAITTQYLQVGMKRAQVGDWYRYLVVPDTSDMVPSVNKDDVAKDLYDRLLISAAAMRRESGFSEEDAPSLEEQAAQMLRLVARIPAGALEIAPLLLRFLGEDDIALDVERLAAFFGGVTEEDILIQSGTSNRSDRGGRTGNSEPGEGPDESAPVVPGSRPEGRPANDPGAP